MSLVSFQCRHRFQGGFELDVAFQTDDVVTSIFGPSGSGKTSVLLTIAGFLRPSSGRVELTDRTLLDTARRVFVAPERRQVGMVFQDHLLFPHLTVEANLQYGTRRRRSRHHSIEMARVLEVLEIGGLLKRYPGSLSGGERARVALGRTLLSGPELLLMDEPLASLDAPLKARVLAYLDRVVDEWRIPTLFVTHGQADVRRLANWVVVIEDGRLITCGTPDEALSQPEPLGWRNSIAPVNLLRLKGIEFRDGRTMGQVGDQLLYLPQKEIPSQGPVFVQFSPVDVTLSRQDVTGLSARNHLQGRIRQLVPLDHAVFVAIDVGQILWAEVTPEAAAELDLVLGSQVTCLMKAHSLRIVT